MYRVVGGETEEGDEERVILSAMKSRAAAFLFPRGKSPAYRALFLHRVQTIQAIGLYRAAKASL